MRITLLILMVLCSGCAIRYYDKESGVEHLWGFGHMKMRVSPANEGVQAMIRRTETLGVGLGLESGTCYFLTGWDFRDRLSVLGQDCSVRIEWPNSDIFNVRVGSRPPFEKPPTPTTPGQPDPKPLKSPREEGMK